MADLIELDLVVREKGLKQSLSTVERLERQIIRAAKAVDNNRISQERYNKVLLSAKREYQALGMSSQKATAAVRKFAEDTRRALTATMGQTEAIDRQTVALQKNAAAANQTRRGTNQLGVLFQQTGYQVGDFAVQVQSGTNYMVALGQQATQLVGTFAMLAKSTRMIALFSGLGIVVPIVTALAAAFLRTRDVAEETADVFERTSDALDRVGSSSESAQRPMSDLAERFGENASQAKLLLQVISAIEKTRFQKSFSEAADSLRGLFDVGEYTAEGIRTLEVAGKAQMTILKNLLQEQRDLLKDGDMLGATQMGEAINSARADFQAAFGAINRDVQSLAERLNVLPSVATEFAAVLASIGEAKTFEDKGQAAVELSQFIQENVDVTNNLTEAENEAVQKAIELSLQFLESKVNLEDTSEATKSVSKGLSDATSEAIALRDALQEVKMQSMSSAEQATVLRAQISAAQKGESILSAKAQAEVAIELGKTSASIDQIAEAAAEAGANAEEVEKLKKTLSELTKTTEKLSKGLSEAEREAERLRKELEQPMVNAIDGVSNAFGDFISRGLSDFKGFVSQVLGSFQSMLAQMIATAARNKIMLSLGVGGAGAAGVTSAFAGPVGGALGTFGSGAVAGSGILGGLGSVFGSGGIGLGGSFGALGGLLGGSVGGLGALGAAIPAIGVVVAGLSLFIGKTKELDSGLRVTVNNMDALVETFSVIQKSRLFGLIKSTRTNQQEAGSEISDPLVIAIGEIQQGAIDAASSLGIASSAFDDFIYNFEVSLKGLTEEEKMQKVNEELVKMGDEFASLTGIFFSMNELLEVAQERYELEVQLLQVQGDVVELRRRELETVHVLNRGLAARLQMLQAEGDLQGALGAFASAISQQQNLIRSAVDALVKPLQEAIDRTRSQAEASYRIFRNAADKTRDEAENIVDIITGALESRTIRSEAVERMRYTQAQQQLASFAGGASFDETSLRRATEGVSIDTTKFFGSFEDYARDFYKTQISLTKLAEKAEGELTDVEKQIDVAEKAYQVAMGTYEEAQDFNVALNTLLNDLATFTEVAARNEPFIEQIKAEGDRQVELLDSILVETTKQINALLGIDDTIADLVGSNVSVGEALSVLGLEGGELAGAVLALEPTVGAIGSHVEDLDLTLSGAIDRLGLTLSELESLDLSEGFLSLDLTSGLETNILGLTTEVSALDTAASGLNLGVVGLDGTVGVLSSSIDKEATNLLTLDGTVVKQTAAVNALTGEVSALTSNVVNLDGTVFGLGTNVSGLGTNVADLGMSASNLGINISDLGTTLTNAMGGLGSIVSSLSGAVSGLAASNNALATAQKNAAKAQVNAAASAITSPISGNIESKAAAEARLQEAIEEQQSTPYTETYTYKTGGFLGLFRKTRTATRINPVYEELGEEIEQLYAKIAEEEAILAPAREQLESLGVTPSFASGGMHSGGMRLVGEQGPELEVTGPSRIYSAQQTKNMLSGGSGEMVFELRSLRREVSELKAEQRKIGTENVKYNKKTYDLNREWDIVGLPATRTS